MGRLLTARIVAVIAIAAPSVAATQQNPSPMVEATRAHERLAPKELGGTSRELTLVLTCLPFLGHRQGALGAKHTDNDSRRLEV